MKMGTTLFLFKAFLLTANGMAFFVSQMSWLSDLSFHIFFWSLLLLSAIRSVILIFPGYEDTLLQLLISFSSLRL